MKTTLTEGLRNEVIRRGLTREEAKQLVNSYPDSNQHIVIFQKQFTAKKYYQQ
mgnify:CR=1 FL=1